MKKIKNILLFILTAVLSANVYAKEYLVSEFGASISSLMAI
jgi:hypothetical protein